MWTFRHTHRLNLRLVGVSGGGIASRSERVGEITSSLELIFPVDGVGQHETDLDINRAKQKNLRTCREFPETCYQPLKQ